MRTIRAGELPVASVSISDGVCDQTVVLILDADENRSVSVVLNRLGSIE